MSNRRALGRGLKALIPESHSSEPEREGGLQSVPIASVRPGGGQPRRQFDDAALAELADSIRQHGVLEPIIARPVGDQYELVVGERRWRAAKLAGLSEIPALVREMGEREAAELALVENLQREDLNPLEEAEAYRRLMEEFGLTQEGVAERVGKQRPTIANRIRLLELDPQVQSYVREGSLSAGHAKVLLGVREPPLQRSLAERCVAEGWSVRALEEALKRALRPSVPRADRIERPLDPGLREIQGRLQRALGTKVRIKHGKDRGRIEIEYYSSEEAERLVELLTRVG